MAVKPGNSEYEIRTKTIGNTIYLFDPVREKWLIETPEEYVRIQCVNYLISKVKVPRWMIHIEHQIRLYNTVKRVDILVKNKDYSNFLMVECKSPSVKITSKKIEQNTRYSLEIKCDYYMVTNGIYQLIYTCCSQSGEHKFLKQLPLYP